MTSDRDSGSEANLVAAQIGRAPRRPWRVGARCPFGHPSAIVSPSVLEDGSPFPTLAWLTCPWLLESIAAEESAGEISRWARRASADFELADRLRETDIAMRLMRGVESGGTDACGEVGIAGQRDPLGVKCLHAHVALALVGLDDPIGKTVLGKIGSACPDRRCDKLACAPGKEEHDG